LGTHLPRGRFFPSKWSPNNFSSVKSVVRHLFLEWDLAKAILRPWFFLLMMGTRRGTRNTSDDRTCRPTVVKCTSTPSVRSRDAVFLKLPVLRRFSRVMARLFPCGVIFGGRPERGRSRSVSPFLAFCTAPKTNFSLRETARAACLYVPCWRKAITASSRCCSTFSFIDFRFKLLAPISERG